MRILSKIRFQTGSILWEKALGRAVGPQQAQLVPHLHHGHGLSVEGHGDGPGDARKLYFGTIEQNRCIKVPKKEQGCKSTGTTSPGP